jgi:glycosyltransferase involved in cell wall biosynthesis
LVYISDMRLPVETGLSVHTVKSCEAFARAGVDVELWHPRRRDAQEVPTIFEYYGVEKVFTVRPLSDVNVMPLERLGPVFPYVFEARSSLWGLYAALSARRDHADLYVTVDVDVAFWLTRNGLPTLWECHRVPRRLGAWEIRALAPRRSLKTVVALTPLTRSELAELGVDESLIIVQGEGVDLRAYEDLPSRSDCRARLGLPAERPIVAYVGRFLTLTQQKGIPELIHALARVPAVEGVEPLLVCVGGPMHVAEEYRQIARGAGTSPDRLLFVDHVPHAEVPLWLRAADVGALVYPSFDHFNRYMSPLKVFEYMAAGLPILATDLPSLAHVLQHRRNAWLIQPGDVEGMADGITALLGDPALRTQLADTGRHDVAQSDWLNRANTLLRAATQRS